MCVCEATSPFGAKQQKKAFYIIAAQDPNIACFADGEVKANSLCLLWLTQNTGHVHDVCVCVPLCVPACMRDCFYVCMCVLV